MLLKIFYLDDELDLCENFVDYFASRQISVTTFTSPNEMIALSKTNPPDLFFIDFRLPDISGDQVASLLPIQIPKYLITGDIQFKPEFDFTGIITKPYEPEIVHKIINSYLMNK